MKTTLYNIENDYLTLISQIEEAEGVLTPELEEALTINETQLQGKSTAYLQVITTKEGINDAIDIEIKRLQAIKKRNGNLVTKLRSRLLEAVKLFGDIEVGFNKFTTRKSSSVQVDDVNSLPSEFKTIKITETPDKKAIKDAIKAGQEIEGCSIVENLNLKIG
tara:strand:- start:243 stop:731 length:489 start_codon:yes stop_codon:yes gene_type:complete